MEDYMLLIDGSGLLSTQYYGNLPREVLMAKSEEEREKKLRKDKDYAAFEKERRKLSIEIAHVISDGGIPSAEMSSRYEELEKLIAEKKAALN